MEEEKPRAEGVTKHCTDYRKRPLLSAGNSVRVKHGGGCRKATIYCVNESEGTVDVCIEPAEGTEEQDLEVTVPNAAVQRLEDFEALPKAQRQMNLQKDIFAAALLCKESGNIVYKKGDLHAAVEYYSEAISELKSFQAWQRAEDCYALTIQDGALVLAQVKSLDFNGKRVTLVPKSTKQPRTLAWQQVIQIRREHLDLQGILYLNRARGLMFTGRQQEAAQDLSVVMAIWKNAEQALDAADSPLEMLVKALLRCPGCRHRLNKRSEVVHTEGREQLAKAYYLRAKTRIARLKIPPAKADSQAAWALKPSEATASVLRRLDAEIEAADKENKRSTRKIVKEISKFADSAMSRLSEMQGAESQQPGMLPE